MESDYKDNNKKIIQNVNIGVALSDAPILTHELSNKERLEVLTKEGRDLVERMKKRGDKSHEMLASLYSNPTHFITELLQNAEDEGAKEVEFFIAEDRLEFSHNATKLFDFNDIRSITNFGDNQEKKQKPNAIGRFGIGFKSVYAITNKPQIISGEFNVTIVDYIVPEQTPNHIPYNGTKFIFPFKEEKKERIFQILSKELNDLNLNYLLFLTNIKSIKCNAVLYERIPEKRNRKFRHTDLFQSSFIALKSDTRQKKYVLIEKSVEVENKNLIVKIAFLLNESDNIIECQQSLLFVFFPTKIETSLKFLIHAPFYTTPARENIQEDSSLINLQTNDDRNQKLTTQLAILLSESLTEFRKMKLLNIEFLKILPINSNLCLRSTIYNEFYQAVKNEFTDNKQLIPNADGGFSSANDLLLLGSSDLASFLKQKQNRKIFGRGFWVDKGVTNDKAKELRDYFRLLNIPEYDLRGFATKIDEPFMNEQDDSWLIQFYKAVHKAPALWKKGEKEPILRSKPIIRIEQGGKIKQVLPFLNGKPNVFLSSLGTSHYKIVKPNIAKNLDAKKFLEELGLTKPDIFAEVNEYVLPSLFRNQEINQLYFDNVSKLVEALQLQNYENHIRLTSELMSYNFILGVNYETGETKLLKYDQIYLPTETLKNYFSGNNSVYFFAEENYKQNSINVTVLKPALKEIGVKDYPLRKKIASTLSFEERYKLRQGRGKEDYCHDFELDGLREFLSQPITIEKSLVLWQLLIKCYVNHSYWDKQRFFYGELNYKFYGPNPAWYDANFLKLLKTKKWIVIENDQNIVIVSPSEMSYSELSDKYKSNTEFSQKLSEILGFKADEIRLIEQRTGGKFIRNDEYEDFRKWKEELAAKEKLKNETSGLTPSTNAIPNSNPSPSSNSVSGANPNISNFNNSNQPNNSNDSSDEQNGNEDGFNPEYKPEEATLNSRKINGNFSGVKLQLKQGGQDNHSDANQNTNNNSVSETERPSQKLLDDIGDWGQDFVARLLADEFNNDTSIIIENRNLPGSVGAGCDFIVRKDNEILRLVEVKATRGDFGQSISVSGTQWELARNYFNECNGDKYWVYCVFNAGQQNPDCVIIENPHQRWQEGTLFAHPINFIIKNNG